MSTLDESSVLARIRETRLGQVFFPTTERGRKRRRIVVLAVPFFILATFGAFYSACEDVPNQCLRGIPVCCSGMDD